MQSDSEQTPRPWKRRWWVHALAGAGILVGAGFAIGTSLLVAGVYDTSATNQHLLPTFALLDVGLRRSVTVRAKDIDVPPLGEPRQLERGLACFRAHCEQCHGAPGVARAPFALGLLPVPSSLSQAHEDWDPAQLYWITRNGIKMTGMPAWRFRLDDEALWALVAFLQVLPTVSPASYRAASPRANPALCDDVAARVGGARADADPERGKLALQQYACTACHVIPGVVGPKSHTGPPLTRMGLRQYIGGVLPNDRANMVRWLLDPTAVSPRTAMPDLGLTEDHAEDIAAYLETLH